eukprot:4599568-Karenia_brevis.AAC.1
MQLRKGQWFLFERTSTDKIWVCPVCGSPFSIQECPFLFGMRTGTEPEDISFLKAAFPDQKDCAIIDLLK